MHLLRFQKFVNKRLEEIKIDDIIKFQNHLKSKYAMANVAYSTTVIKNFFEFHRRQSTIVLDPFLIKVPKFSPHSHNPVSKEEFEKMDRCTGAGEFWEVEKKLIVRLLWETGVRVSELCDLNVSDIDLKQNAAQIRTKKNGQLRWIFWSGLSHDLLVKYMGTRICMNQRPAMFISTSYQRRDRVTPRTVQRWIKEGAQSPCIL